MSELIIIVLIVISGSALCAMAETALFSVSDIKVQQLAESKNKSALVLLKLQSQMNRAIATIVILNNSFNIVGSIVIGRIAAAVLGNVWFGLFSGFLTFLIIIFGEIIPKTIGARYSEKIALMVAIPVATLTFLFAPVVWIIEITTAPLTRGEKEPTTDEAEIKFLAKIGKREGIIEDDEAAMIQRVFRLNDLTAVDLMTPRTKMTYLQGDRTLSEVQAEIIASQHTRIIVISESIDKVVGVVLKAELLAGIIGGKQSEKVASLMRKVRFVPETVRADKLLIEFQETREHMVVVLDEYGGVSGVVTLEDVLEVLTGEIVDETDQNIDLQETARQQGKQLLENVD